MWKANKSRGERQEETEGLDLLRVSLCSVGVTHEAGDMRGMHNKRSIERWEWSGACAWRDVRWRSCS